MSRCSCNGALHMAEGGSVDDDLSKPSFRKPLIGKRREDRQDRKGAAEAPLSMGRGVIAGALGLPGDLESLGRLGVNWMGGNVDPAAAIPTSEFWNEYLPLRASESRGRGAWEGAGNMFAPGPLSMATKGIRASAPAAKAVAREFAPQAQRMLERLPGAQPAYAVKPPGGNWMPNTREKAGGFARDWEPEGEEDSIAKVSNWIDKNVQQYITKHLGTATDPFLQLEKEGKLHTVLDPELLAFHTKRIGQSPAENAAHLQLTGRTERTPWEIMADSQLSTRPLSRVKDRFPASETWINKADPNTPTYEIQNTEKLSRNLGFDDIRDYLQKGVDAYDARDFLHSPSWTPSQDTIARFAEEQRMISADMDINPEKLNRMSLVDAARNTRNYNDWLESKREWNQGIKRLVKEYPQPADIPVAPGKKPGSRWIELDAHEEALRNEGEVMRNCIKEKGMDYCGALKSGRKRLLSYRDAEGPHVTVELTRPDSPMLGRGDEHYDLAEKEVQDRITAGEQIDDHVAATTDRAYDLWNEGVAAGKVPWNISQIKGKNNFIPDPQYHPVVEDLLMNHGPWGNVSSKDFNELPFLDLRGDDAGEVFKGLSLTPPKSGIYHKDKMRSLVEEANPGYQFTNEMLDNLGIPQNNFEDGGSVGDGDGLDAPAFDPAPPDATFDPGAPAFDPGTVGTGVDVGFVDAPSSFEGTSLADMGSMGGMGGITGFDFAEESVPDIGQFSSPNSMAPPTVAGKDGLAGLFGLSGKTANVANQVASFLGGKAGAPTGAFGMFNAAINQSAPQAAGTMGGIAGGIFGGPIGAMAGHALASFLAENAPGVPATSVPHDQSSSMSFEPGVVAQSPTIAALPDVPKDDIASARYFTERANQATPRLSSVMMAKGGRVRGPLSY